MTDLDRMIRARVDAFVDEISQLVRRSAVEAVSEALQGDRPARPRAKPRGKPARPTSKRSGKRSAAELDSLAERILRNVGEHPGAGAREIASALGVATKDLVLPTKKLLSMGSLTTKGQKRATRYFRGKK